MAGEQNGHRELGVWVGIWDVVISFALLVGVFLLVRLSAVVQLRELAADKSYFATKPLLLDAHRRRYSFQTVRDHLHTIKEEGRSFYAHSFIPVYDIALSFFLLTFMIIFILYATQSDRHYALGLPRWVRFALLVPPVLQFLIDVGENLLLRELIASFPRLAPRVVEEASGLTQFKWMVLLVNWLIIGGLGSYTIYQWLAAPAQARKREAG